MFEKLKRIVCCAAILALCLIVAGTACLAEAQDGPELNVRAEKTEDGMFVISGTTDGAGVSVGKNGEAIAVELAEDGTYTSEGFAIVMGDTVEVRAWDEAGNSSVKTFAVHKNPVGEIGEVWPIDEGAHNSVGTLALRGWYAVRDENTEMEAALYRVEWTEEEEDGKRVDREMITPVGDPIDLSSKTQMSDRELALHTRLWPEDADVTVGYNFTVEVPMYDFGISQTGQYVLLLRQYDPDRNVYYEISRCEPPFIVRAWPDWVAEEG